MAVLQRSTVSFRREGSSGSVWDEGFFSEELYQLQKSKEGNTDYRELRPSQSTTAITIGTMKRKDSPASAGPPACPRSYSTMPIHSKLLQSENRLLKKLSSVVRKSNKPTSRFSSNS